MSFLLSMRTLRHIFTGGSLLVALFVLVSSLQSGAALAATRTPKTSHITLATQTVARQQNPASEQLRQMVREGRLASTVRVLDALPPATIIQFPLFPRGIKSSFPQATGLVTMIRGNRDDSVSDTIIVDVENMPPNITFTIFYIQFAGKPFGNVEYVADLTTRGDGSGETMFQNIAFVAFAMDANNPGTSTDGLEGATSGTNLEHLGMWFASLQDAQRVLNDDSLQGTIFDGGAPAMHAGPQAMTDGQSAPVF